MPKITKITKIIISILVCMATIGIVLLLYFVLSKNTDPTSIKLINENFKENDDLTIIITASVIPSHPDITMIKETMKSLDLINHKNSKIILAHDYSDKKEYKAYLKNLENYVENMENVQIVVRDDWGHLTGNVRNAMKYVKTKYILLVQHDFPFIQAVDIHKIIEDLKSTPELKYIRFNKRNNNQISGWEKEFNYNNLYNKYQVNKNYSYISSPNWSDNNHICSTEYYNNVILKISKDKTAMENNLKNIKRDNKFMNKFGPYIFGDLNQKAYINHLDGADRKSDRQST